MKLLDIFLYNDYKKYTVSTIEAQEKGGRGLMKKIAEHIGIHSVVVSQVLKGERDFTQEQALELSGFFGHSSMQEEFFLLLVDRQRAGTVRLKNRFTQKIEKLREESKKIENRVSSQKILSEYEKAKFYSDWYYSGTRLISSIPGQGEVKKIAERFRIPQEKVQLVVEFLLEAGLCKIENGTMLMGPSSTHLSSSSPLVQRHHKNWRLKAIEEMDRESSKNMFFTSPMTMSEEVVEKVRSEILSAIERSMEWVDPSPCETAYCMNIDWFSF